MSGSTPELALGTAVDADDTADYLTITLANSLRTVDGLYNNVTGHTHNGAHQGGPIGSIPASAIPDGTITSAKIADGAVTSLKIADGTIATVDIAATAVTQATQYSATNSASTTSATAVPITGAIATITTVGGPVLVWANLAVYDNASAGATIYIQRDGGSWTPIATSLLPTANQPFTLGGHYIDSPAAGVHTWQLGFSCTTGTLSVTPGAITSLVVLELKR